MDVRIACVMGIGANWLEACYASFLLPFVPNLTEVEIWSLLIWNYKYRKLLYAGSRHRAIWVNIIDSNCPKLSTESG